MIFTKDVTFPYPVLTDRTDDYSENTFILSINVYEENNEYVFEYNVDIKSKFILHLLETKKAYLWLVFQTKDNIIKQVETLNGKVKIDKKYISLNERAIMQATIQAGEDINFSDNTDLNEFYDRFKSEFIVRENMLLGYSNDLRFDGNLRRPLQIFEKKVDDTISSEIKIDLLEDIILITYKSEDYQFKTYRDESFLNNMYVYLGLSRALERFIDTYGMNDGEVDLTNFSKADLTREIDIKLYGLMENRSISSLNKDNLDEVISRITEQLVSRYVTAIGRLNTE